MMSPVKSEVVEIELPKGRLVAGGIIFFVGFLSPLLVPLLGMSSLPATWKTVLSGLLLLGIPELAMLIAAAVMGKAGFSYLKKRIFGFLGRHFAPPETVGPIRYRFGLVLFSIPLLVGWISPYVSEYLPLLDEYRLWIAILGDLILLSSLIVLGGEFWDKLRALFVHRAKVNI